MIELFDTHAHLQEPEFEVDRDAAIERALAAGVSTIVVPAVDVETAEAAIALAEVKDRRIRLYATAGFHPHEASRATPQALARIEALLAHPRVVAVGETGLDYYRMHSPREAQRSSFEAHLALAERHDLPVVIHCRDAWDDLRELIVPWARRVRSACDAQPDRAHGDAPLQDALGVLHYFSNSVEDALSYSEMGFLISIHTSVTHPKAQGLRDVAAALPLDALVIETDSPYGAPQSHRGKRNEPAYVFEAAEQIAAARGISLDEVASATTANAARLFRLRDRSGHPSPSKSAHPEALEGHTLTNPSADSEIRVSGARL